MKNNVNYIFRRVLTFFTIFFILSCLKSCQVHAETIEQQLSQPFRIQGNSSDPSGYVLLYNSIYGGPTTNFKYGIYPFMLLDQNLIQFNEYETTSGNFDYILQLSICQTSNDMTLNYDSGSVHSYVRDVSTIGAVDSGTCKINVYTGKSVNYYIYINAQKRINENCNSDYCVIGQQFVMRWASNSYNEFRVLSQKYYEYTDEIANMLANAKTQTEINNKLQQQLDLQNQQMQQQHQDSINEQNAINQNTQAQNQTNNTLKDNSVDDPNSQFVEFEGKLANNNTITQLILLPVNLFTKILSTIDGSCSNFALGNLFGTDLNLPCINVSDYLGSSLWSIIDILFSGIFVYTISKKMIKVFENMSSMKESDDLSD